MGFKAIPSAIAILIALIIWFIIPVPAGVTPQAWHLLAMFIGVIAAIIGKAMPIGAIAFIAILLVALTGVTSDSPSVALQDALSSFANPLIWLIGFAVMISRGLIKTGLGARIGYYFISIFGKKTLGIGYGLTLAELTIAPVTPSNTARGGAVIHPIMRSIAASYDSDPEHGTQGRIGKYLALVNYHANPITSAMFITRNRAQPAGGEIGCGSYWQKHSFILEHLGIGHAAAWLSGNCTDAAGAVLAVSTGNQKHAECRRFCQTTFAGNGQNDPWREDHAGGFCRAVVTLGGHSGHDPR